MATHKKLNIKRLIIRTFFSLSIGLFIACKADKNLADNIYCNSDEYWEVYTPAEGFRGVYFRFYKDFSSDRFKVVDNKMVLNESDGDLIYEREKWLLSSDSIMNWGMHKYDLVKLDKTTMVLYHPNDIYLVLLKVNKNKLMKGRRHYEQKRIKYPVKYLP